MLQSQLEVTMPLTSKHHMRYHSHVLHFFVKHVGFICLYSSLNMVTWYQPLSSLQLGGLLSLEI